MMQPMATPMFVPIFNMGTQFLYRVLRPDENPQVGIVARAPMSSISVEFHVSEGSKIGYPGSKYISTSKSLAAAQTFASRTTNKPVRIVEINVEALMSCGTAVFYDLTDDQVLNTYIPSNPSNQKARNYAAHFQEVLIVGTIPAQCLRLVD